MLALGIGLGIALLLVEIVLRVYNPFQSRLRGGDIVLPANMKYEFKQVNIPGLAQHIVHHKNSMGFRGPELDSAVEGTRIFCVGGSTTECFYLGDGEDWPAIVMQMMQQSGKSVWINNAGLDGHSTFGHTLLLKQHILKYKPNVVVFLIGCNDVAADGLNAYEQYHLSNKKRWLENFETFNLYLSWKRSRNAATMGVGHQFIDIKTWPKADTSGWRSDTSGKVQEYRKRVLGLAEICWGAGATPIFITQPTLLAPGIDPVTGIQLGTLSFQGKSALHYWTKLHQYNQAVKGIGAEYADKIHVIDLATLLPSSTDNYYDFFHFTQTGSRSVAEIIFKNWPLIPHKK